MKNTGKSLTLIGLALIVIQILILAYSHNYFALSGWLCAFNWALCHLLTEN